MKQPVFLLIVLLAVAAACGAKKEGGDELVEWKEMDEFHLVMSEVFHPLKDSGNLEPIKKDADDLAAAATKWAQAKLPSRVDNDATKQQLSELEDGTQLLSKMVKEGATDEEIKAKLTALHDTFHAIMESWYKSGKEEGAEEHHDH